jgi:hypothetical protein
LLGLLLDPEDGDYAFLRNVCDFYRTTWCYNPGDRNRLVLTCYRNLSMWRCFLAP